ncbi:transposase [Oligoflexia bacterium]|nr:transposase [Oligoflexia bacterium]
MSYHQRIETKKVATFQTTRSRNSELWFVNNPKLTEEILGNSAKCQKRYQMKLYALAIEGNHIHFSALFPKLRRADFMRDFNSAVARAVVRNVPTFPGGSFWARRYSSEFVPGDASVEDNFFYTVLQPVQDGLVEKISKYPGYNCFHDAVWGIKRKFKLVNWTAYHDACRWNPRVKITDFMTEYELEYSRLPGYEDLSQKEYAKLMNKKLEARRQEIVAKRYEDGLGFAGRDALLKIVPGSLPSSTKTSTRYRHRPRVLCVCAKLRRKFYDWYFSIYADYKEASRLYRAGETNVEFPPGTYKPPNFTVVCELEPEDFWV